MGGSFCRVRREWLPWPDGQAVLPRKGHWDGSGRVLWVLQRLHADVPVRQHLVHWKIMSKNKIKTSNTLTIEWSKTACIVSNKHIRHSPLTCFLLRCREAGIECQEVSGHGKGIGYRQGQSYQNTKSLHMWNAVKLGGHWYLLDACWGAGRVDMDNKAFIKRWIWLPSKAIGLHDW